MCRPRKRSASMSIQSPALPLRPGSARAPARPSGSRCSCSARRLRSRTCTGGRERAVWGLGWGGGDGFVFPLVLFVILYDRIIDIWISVYAQVGHGAVKSRTGGPPAGTRNGYTQGRARRWVMGSGCRGSWGSGARTLAMWALCSLLGIRCRRASGVVHRSVVVHWVACLVCREVLFLEIQCTLFCYVLLWCAAISVCSISTSS